MIRLPYDSHRIHRSAEGWRGTYYDKGEPIFSMWLPEPLEIAKEAERYVQRRPPVKGPRP